MIDKSVPGLWIYADGRERTTRTEAGRLIIHQRWSTAWKESHGICCLCDAAVNLSNATLEHKTAKGSGGGKHDDRQENLAISHRSGNQSKGSMSLEQYRKLPVEVRRANCRY